MPVTFLAHQAPVLPLARSSRVDGVALVVGSMAPDLAYVAAGSRFSVWAHGWPAVVTFCVPVTLVVTLLIRRLLAPVVPAHLPALGVLRLDELRGLAVHRFRWGPLLVGAIVGALSHVALDSFTHDWGWWARTFEFWSTPVNDSEVLGRWWPPYRLAQYGGHVIGVVAALVMLGVYGRAGWMSDRAAQVPTRTSPGSHLVLWSAAAVGLGAAAVWVLGDRGGSAIDVIRLAGGLFAGLCVGSALVRASSTPRVQGPATPA